MFEITSEQLHLENANYGGQKANQIADYVACAQT
jgi:hypothetical protein